jgi:hypothetical protein
VKLYAPDKSMLIDVRAVKEHADGLVIEGKIMGSMPMKAVLRPEEIRAIFALLTSRVVWRAVQMIVLGSKFSARQRPKP